MGSLDDIQHRDLFCSNGECLERDRSIARCSWSCRQRAWCPHWGQVSQQVSLSRLYSSTFYLVSSLVYFRTMRCKNISLFASTVSLAAFLTIALRWRGAINVWESLYILPAAMGVGLLNSSQFIGLSAAVQRSQLATTISTFFLSQQLGMMVGAATSAALLKSIFRSGLVRLIGDNHTGSEQVGAPNNLAFKLQLTGQLAYKKHPERYAHCTVFASSTAGGRPVELYPRLLRNRW